MRDVSVLLNPIDVELLEELLWWLRGYMEAQDSEMPSTALCGHSEALADVLLFLRHYQEDLDAAITEAREASDE